MHGEAGWDLEFERHLPRLEERLRPRARRWLPREADDLVQETLMAVHSAGRSGQPILSLVGFSLRVLRHKALERRRFLAREEQRLRWLPVRIARDDGTADAEREAERAELERIVADELRQPGVRRAQRAALIACRDGLDPLQAATAHRIRLDSFDRALDAVRHRLFGIARPRI
jgi:DNA-directed RNA polymerase specialized sigma24 family protein